MKTKLNLLVAGMFLAATSSAWADVRYVNINNANPTPPYTNWATAATNIQSAVDAAGAGDEIVVTNGTYSGGYRVDPIRGYSGVVVDKPLVLSSVKGPEVTIIDGGSTVRCLYLTNNAMLVGFTLTNGGAVGFGGGVYCESASTVLSNCVLTGNSAFAEVFGGISVGGGVYGGTLNNCTLTANRASYGGGAESSMLNNCKLAGNSAESGGGAYSCTLNNCTLTGNSAQGGHGLVFFSYNFGGGAYDSTLNNCTLTGNTASAVTLGFAEGGGAYGGTLNNCTLSGNSANSVLPSGGGGAYSCTLNNCTLTANSAYEGGGAANSTLNNCIAYFNSDLNGGNYDPSSTLNYCCTTPQPTNGTGNISVNPQLASASHLSALSPCIGAGSATYASGTDIDGEAWANPPSIGCDEYHAGAVTGPLTVSLTATLTNVLIGNPVGLTAFIEGRTDLSVWDFGDGFVQVNEPYTSHTWTAPGYYLVALWAFNDSYAEGVSATVTIYVDEGVHYVAATSGNPVAPYTSWATAATNIQDAVDVAAPGATIFVTNGVYAPVTVNTPLTLQSVNGPGVTVINGLGTAECLHLTNDAVVMGFTLTNGWAGNGGGVYCESTNSVLTNCVLTGNSAYGGWVWSGEGGGGGAYGGTLNNCTLTGNSANIAGGAYNCTLNNCTLTGNVAYGIGNPGGGDPSPGFGGGACDSTLNNCTLTGNSAGGPYPGGGGSSGGGAGDCTLNKCVLTGNTAYDGSGGGACGGTLNNCTLTGNSADNGGGAYYSTLNNCTLTGNSANGYWGGWNRDTHFPGFGGGACDSILNNCTLIGNSASDGCGGGASSDSQPCTLNNCTLTGNWASDGGGAFGYSGQPCTLTNCTLTGNSAWDSGGGAYNCGLNNCTLTGNLASADGGGACESTLNNCIVSGNSTDSQGGGAYGGTLNNCTLSGNSAPNGGGGAYSCTLDNCIVYFNSDPNGGNYDPSSTLNYCCTTPQPTNGVGNISADPQLASASHLSAASPCIRAGSAAYASGTDIDGEAWANPPSIGCDEYHAGAVTGPLAVNLTATLTDVLRGYPVRLTAFIAGRTDLSVWDFGDGYVATNEPYTSHTWTAPGDYLVALWAFSDSYPEGVSATVTVHVEVGLHYVAATSGNPVAPYTSWATAATNIQQAVDVAPPGATIFVTNGVYAPVTVATPLTLQSINGPDVTIIDGGGTQQCVYLNTDAVMVGFTLTNGVGGASCNSTNAVLSNCVLTGNAGYYGGGAHGGTLNNCTLTGNSAQFGYGGGAYGCTLNNCTLTGNSTYYEGGGAYSCTLNNCIVYFNSARSGGNYDPSSALNYCCTTPMPTNGVGNISADPQLASASHLSAESPCIRAGSATYASGTDIDGEAWANPPSIGCDEYHAGAVTGPLTVSLTATLTNSVRGYPVGLTAFIAGRTDLSVWDFGDGYVAVNQPYTSHAWTAPGNYLVTLWAFNDSFPGGVSATLTIHIEEGVHYVSATSGNPVAPYTSWATAATNIQQAVDVVPPGATIFVSNGVYARVNVDKPLTLQSINGPGVTIINGGGTQQCVYLTNDAVMVGFTLANGSAYEGAADGGGVYCESTSAVLSNCVLTGNSAYGEGGGAYGGTLNNCVLVGNSVPNDDAVGGGASRCTLNNCTLTHNTALYGQGAGAYDCTLNNCTLTGNSAEGTWLYEGEGGGAFYCTLNNCTLTGNSASSAGGGAASCTLNNCIVYFNSAIFGGGVALSTLNNCTLSDNSATRGYNNGNSADGYGGGANYSTLNNCVLTGNTALFGQGGGAVDSTLNNCIVYFNTAANGANYYQDQYGGVLNYCCTTPMPTIGVGNITNTPLFVNYAGGNLHLQSNSPCINSGDNAYVTTTNDLDGNPRIVGGTVDIGAYEYQTPASIISYAWLQQYGLPTDGSVDHADLDGTGMNVYQDWVAGLNPTNALSVLKMLPPAASNNPLGLVVSWQSVSNITYFLQRSTNLAAQPAFSTIQSNIVGQAGTTSYTDTTATNAGPYFYRVGVGN